MEPERRDLTIHASRRQRNNVQRIVIRQASAHSQRGPQAPRFIVIEGPLRVGKTTLAKVLAERLHARRVYDCEDNPFLHDFYKEKPGSAFRAQMYFLMERQKRLRETLAVEAPGPVLSDFLMEKDRIFANLNLNDEELKLYDRYYETLAAEIPAPDLVIYLQAKPEILRARIAKKASRDETQISLEYIEEVARAYEHFFFRYRCFRPAGNQHLGHRFRRAQRRPPATPAPPPRPRQGHAVFPSPRRLRIGAIV